MNGIGLSIFWFDVPLLIFFTVIGASRGFETSANGSLLRCKEDSTSQSQTNPPHHTINECHRKIRLTIDLFNTDKTPEGLEFIYVKEVANPVTGLSLKLLNPIVVRLRQTQVVLAFPFKYLGAVNGKATEIVVNYENRKNFTGCDDTSSIYPTCGIKHVKGQAVPYSEGFCCFCPKMATNKKQERGGQDCSLEVDPENYEAQRFKASAHCLHFNDVWYTVNDMSDPKIIHNIFLQVYNQRFLSNGSAVWLSLTHDEEFEIGNANPSHFDANKTIVAMFYTVVPKNGTWLISSDQDRLLMPLPIPGVPIENLPPPLKNGATDYLLLSKSVIDMTGEACDVAGVSHPAFAKQPDRCKVTKDTCLKNQPLEFWDADDKLRASGKKGKYLLENYGTPYKDPIIYNKETKEHWLALEYYQRQHTVVTIELKADDIVILKPGKRAQISVVLTASFEKRIEFFVGVANKGLVPATFRVYVARCEYWVPDSAVKSITVPPQRAEEIEIVSRPGEVTLAEDFSCFVYVNSTAYGVVATREVTVKPLGRCICNMHCECACFGQSLECKPMSLKDFHSAGFRGSLPRITSRPSSESWAREHPSLALLASLLVLLITGFVKAALGYTGRRKIGHFGLKSLIFKPKRIKRYFERELRSYKVQYDVEGYPISPETNQRSSVLSEEIIFLLNVFFFFVWPFKAIADCILKRKGSKGSDTISENTQDYTDLDSDITDEKEENERDTEDQEFYNDTLPSSNPESDPPAEDELPPKPPRKHPKRLASEEQPRNPDYHDTSQSEREPESAGTSPITSDDDRPITEPVLLNSGVTGLNTAVSDSVLEFVASQHEGELPLVTKELARWQKGTARINAFKMASKSSKVASGSSSSKVE